mgnify:CR=1 FL=1
MTLQQLRYATAVADTGTISRAAQQFFIAQPSLTNAIRELEQEVGLTIFHRTNRGVALTPEGEEFLGYARQVLAQMELIEEKYLGSAPVKHQFCVSAQHYSFAVEAFVELLKEYGGEEYDFRIRETQTYEIIEDVPIIVVKKDKSREVFDRNKILKGMLRACEKRPVTVEALETAISEIETTLQSALDREVTSVRIGELIMEKLRGIDEVAYVRFASVYKEFDSASAFVDEISKLQ